MLNAFKAHLGIDYTYSKFIIYQFEAVYYIYLLKYIILLSLFLLMQSEKRRLRFSCVSFHTRYDCKISVFFYA